MSGVLALDVGIRYSGLAHFSSLGELLQWQAVALPKKASRQGAWELVAPVLEAWWQAYAPEVVVLEWTRGSRLWQYPDLYKQIPERNTSRFFLLIMRWAVLHQVPVYGVGPDEWHALILPERAYDRRDKRSVALRLMELYPELWPELDRPRQRVGRRLFYLNAVDAVGVGHWYFHQLALDQHGLERYRRELVA